MFTFNVRSQGFDTVLRRLFCLTNEFIGNLSEKSAQQPVPKQDE